MEKRLQQDLNVDSSTPFKFIADSSSQFSLKKWIIEYFDYVINKIDLDTEFMLMNNLNDKIDQINKIRKAYINVIENMQNYNLKQYEMNKFDLIAKLDKYFYMVTGNDAKNQDDVSEKKLIDVKRSLFKEHCVYVEKDILDMLFNKEFLLGALVVTDSFLDESFVDYLRNLIKSDLSFSSNYFQNDINYDSDSEMDDMDIILDQNLFYYKMLSEKLENNSDSSLIIRIDSKNITNLTKLEMKEFSIKSISNNVFETLKLNQLRSLNLSSNKIDLPIKKNMFNGLQNLDELNLSTNQIDIIEANAFQYLTNLTILNLSSNKIEYLSIDTLSGLNKLINLDLSMNRIKSIQGGLFRRLNLLKKLNLSTNKFDTVQCDAFKDLFGLEVLYLCNNLNKSSFSNKIKSIDKDAFNDLINLKELYLNNQTLDTIDSNTFLNLPSLKILMLKSSDSSLFEKQCFVNLKKIDVLVLNGNNNYLSEPIHIKKSHFKSINQLNELEMTDYWIKSIDSDSFKYLSNLTVLKLTKNKLDSINLDCLKQLKNLKMLDLSENKIIHLHQFKFSGSSKLEELNLKKNSIDTIHYNTFTGLSNLKSLNLSENPLCNLQSGSFNCLENLLKLDLSKTNITKLTKYDFFEKLSKLEELYLKSLNHNFKTKVECRLKIEKHAFSNLRSLKILNLQSNPIKEVSRSLTEGLDNLIELNISDNIIDIIEEDSFIHMIHLKELFLNDNQIKVLNKNIFNDVLAKSLEVLDLSDNLIEYRNENDLNAYAIFRNLKNLNLTNNDIDIINISIENYLQNLLPNLADITV